jgi:CheY-like chemotaxis protein
MNRVLIVDDEQDILETLQLILEMEGYVVDTASTGQQALEKMSAIVPDLVLSDVMMPVMNGIELLKRLKAHPQYRAIPIIISSAGNIDAHALRVSQEAGRPRCSGADRCPRSGALTGSSGPISMSPTGSHTVNVAPCPRSLDTSIRPPCSVTICCVM